jgi:PAS domain S-box-containing protein
VPQLEAIIETATDGIITIDEEGTIELVNPAAARLFGYEQEELLGASINILMPTHHAEQHDGYIQRYLQTGEAQIIGIGREVKGKRKDGQLFPIRLSISEVPVEGRRLFTGIVHDLSEQKAVEARLRQEKERAQQYLNLANTVVVAIGPQGQVQMINKKGCHLLEMEESEAVGQDWLQLAVPAPYRKEIALVFDNLLKGQLIDYYENLIQSKSGEEYLIAWHNTVLRNAEGEVESVLSSGIDISAQRQAEDRIVKLNTELEKRVESRTEELAEVVNKLLDINKQLKHEIAEREAAEEALRENERKLTVSLAKEKELNELKSRFVSMASHEFRTPLSTIQSSADLIEAYKKEEQHKKRLRHTGRIKSSVANLTSILNDFLSLSKLEEGKIAVHPATFELKEVWNEVYEGIQGLMKPGQEIRMAGLEDIPELYMDKRMLQNIFYNLLSNALKYSEAGKAVDCRLSRQGDCLKIEIADRGIGIPESEQQHLFTRFFRAHNVENIQGTGLGLNIVKGYTEHMGGSIALESQLGEGTTVRVALPLHSSTKS